MSFKKQINKVRKEEPQKNFTKWKIKPLLEKIEKYINGMNKAHKRTAKSKLRFKEEQK
jgi:hypothetical protein